MLRAIKTFIKDPEVTTRRDEVVEGLNVVEGIIRMGEPLRSPVKGQNCAAYFYQGILVITGGRAPAQHKLAEAEVYGSFDLEMDGGTLAVEPAKKSPFTREKHAELSKQYGKEFVGLEEVILPGAKVRLRGPVKDTRGELVLKIKDVTVLEKQAVSVGVVGDRKKRRKKQKKK
jgi:hypothetical protein